MKSVKLEKALEGIDQSIFKKILTNMIEKQSISKIEWKSNDDDYVLEVKIKFAKK